MNKNLFHKTQVWIFYMYPRMNFATTLAITLVTIEHINVLTFNNLKCDMWHHLDFWKYFAKKM
jgi:hypothetical protein